MVMLNMNLSRGQNIAGWDFQTTSSGGTAVIAYGPTFPKVYVANAGTGTLYLDGTNSSSLWNLNTSATTELNAFTGSGVNVGTGMTATTTSPACLALVSSSANGKFAVIKFSMTGRKNLIVSYSSQRTSSGFTSQKWEYSTDGSSWFPALTFVSGAVAGTITASFATTGVLSFSTTGLDNAATAYLRLTGAGATTITGNNRIDNIQLNADCIPQDDNNACTTDACNSLTGITTHTNVADGTSCNDGNPCTKNDVCINGTCKGSPIICVASDQCHDAGVCINGVCTDPAKANGSACNDGDPCTENDVCVNGACAGTPIVCPPLDQCHDAVCVNGVCTYLPKPDGTHCDDGDPCTKNDVCTNGTCAGTPIVCPPSADPCDGPGVCVNGICIYQPIVCPPSTDPCDGPGVCVNGICIYQPIVCPPSPDPCVTGVCVNGVCRYFPIICPPPADPCDGAGVCVNGVCQYNNPVVCPPSTDPCDGPGVCVNGVCQYNNPVICPPPANPCDGPGVCVNGVCQYNNPVICIPPDQCHNAVCVNGVCQYPPKPDGATCDDGNPCTENDICRNGVCAGTPVNTDDGNPCTADACDPSTGVITHTLTCAALNATILIEGYYLGGGLMTNCYFTTLQSPDPSDADVITISAMDPVAPFGLVDAQAGRLKTNGDVSVTFGVAVVAGNSYYLKVNHRNSVETWSAVPVLLTTASTYSFSSATSQAFSGNEATTFDALYAAMYTGDINQDCAVDGSDFLILDPDIQAGAGGYIVTDLNGDGSVDGSDFLIFDPNSQNGVGCIIP